MSRLKWRAMLLALLVLPAAAKADPGLDLSANAGIVSDYRFRGISLSGRDPALQGGVDAETDVGFFAGAWASTIADYGGANVEVDLYAGYKGSVAEIDYSVGGYAYLYPGGEGVNYIEIQAHAERAFGPVTLAVEASVAPRQHNVETANLYLGGSAAVEIQGTGITANFRGGRENGSYDDKWDWEAGASYTLSALTASISYVDSNYSGAAEAGRLGGAGVVLSVVGAF